MVNTDNENIDNEKVLGGKRKNGHKMDCGCHICENMKAKAKRHGYKEDLQKEEEKRKGGPKKINGHKVECDCQICNNMKHSKSKSKGKNNNKRTQNTLRKKKNGHKSDCTCPICNNMKKEWNKTKKGGVNEQDGNQDEKEKEKQKQLAIIDQMLRDKMDPFTLEYYNIKDQNKQNIFVRDIIGHMEAMLKASRMPILKNSLKDKINMLKEILNNPSEIDGIKIVKYNREEFNILKDKFRDKIQDVDKYYTVDELLEAIKKAGYKEDGTKISKRWFGWRGGLSKTSKKKLNKHRRTQKK